MSLAVKNLDDRDYQDIVEEAIKRIPSFCKNWTDHNASDPGITLIELFAWMTDMLLYRLNQVPEMHYVKFMEMLGITLGEPKAAGAPVTFYLSKAQSIDVTIPKGTVVATTQTETQSSIPFATDEAFSIHPPVLQSVFKHTVSGSGSKKSPEEIKLDLLQRENGPAFDMFSTKPQKDDAFVFGFENDLSYHLLAFHLTCEKSSGENVNPKQPPYVWEAFTGDKRNPWASCEVEEDSTQALNTSGSIWVHLPEMCPGKYEGHSQELFWVRVKIKEITAEDRSRQIYGYTKSPRLISCETESWGATIQTTHCIQVQEEFLGFSDGTPGQRFRLQSTPLLPREAGEHLRVEPKDCPPEIWKEAKDLADNQYGPCHYTLDGSTGEIRLPPAVRQPDGKMMLYGAVPPKDARLVFTSYRSGGGIAGNVGPYTINTPKTDIPYVNRVSNRKAASGGLDAETLEAAMMRAPAMLRSRDRAVSQSDFEYLACEAFNREEKRQIVGRVKCLQPPYSSSLHVNPGEVYVLVIPHLENPLRQIKKEELELAAEDIDRLARFLDEYRLLTTKLVIRQPEYQYVSIKVTLRAAPGAKQASVTSETVARLEKFLNPLIGGPDGAGWPFSRDLFISDIYQCLQGLPNVQFIRSVEMKAVEKDGKTIDRPVEMIPVLDHAVVASGTHSVEFV